ncbi:MULTISPECIES: hypothetical protein [Paenibacillus]|uniref:Uncharacterized protein n=1 Tax=Paenibacillus vulneris TaxID=1133364 RepID=A0ABW3UN43_9BACL|nr:hypothetical protein [Paenibacillus sp. 32352]
MSIEIDGIAKRIADAIDQPFFIDPYTVRIAAAWARPSTRRMVKRLTLC